MLSNGPYLKNWYPGLGEVSVLRSFPRPVLEFIRDAADEDPEFVGEYLVPLLDRPDALGEICDDLSDAVYNLECEMSGLGELGYLGKSAFKRLSKAIKKVHAAVEKKIMPKAILKVEKKVSDVGKKVAQKYGSTIISVAGAILAPFTGGASLAAAAVLVAANNAYQKKRLADKAKKASAANADQLVQEAAAADAVTARQVDDFYNQNQAWFVQAGVTPDKWAGMTLQQKIDTINAGANGTLKVGSPPPPTPVPSFSPEPPSTQPMQPPGYAPSGGGYAPSGGGYAPSGGGGGGGGDASSVWGGQGIGPSGATSPYTSGGSLQQPATAQAGMFGDMGGMLLPALAIGAAIMFFGKKTGSGSRRRRNPSRRRHRCVA
jgi:hypothetical protein